MTISFGSAKLRMVLVLKFSPVRPKSKSMDDMDDMDDVTVAKSLAGDPFHKGLDRHGKFEGFSEDKRSETGGHINSLTDEEIKASRSKLARLVCNTQLQLVLAYIGTILLMGKAYA